MQPPHAHVCSSGMGLPSMLTQEATPLLPWQVLLLAASDIHSRYSSHLETRSEPEANRAALELLLSRARQLLQLLDEAASETNRGPQQQAIWSQLTSLTWCPVMQNAPAAGEGVI